VLTVALGYVWTQSPQNTSQNTNPQIANQHEADTTTNDELAVQQPEVYVQGTDTRTCEYSYTVDEIEVSCGQTGCVENADCIQDVTDKTVVCDAGTCKIEECTGDGASCTCSVEASCSSLAFATAGGDHYNPGETITISVTGDNPDAGDFTSADITMSSSTDGFVEETFNTEARQGNTFTMTFTPQNNFGEISVSAVLNHSILGSLPVGPCTGSISMTPQVFACVELDTDDIPASSIVEEGDEVQFTCTGRGNVADQAAFRVRNSNNELIDSSGLVSLDDNDQAIWTYTVGSQAGTFLTQCRICSEGTTQVNNDTCTAWGIAE